MNRRNFLRTSSLAALASGTLPPLPVSRQNKQKETVEKKAVEKEAVKSVDELVTDKARTAIQTGLKYLASKQIAGGHGKGSFGTGGYAGGVAVSALSGLAFLCSGSSPSAGPYAENIRRCTDFVLRNVGESGFIAEPDRRFANMYGHGYAMLYLTQVFGMSKRKDLRSKLEKSIQMTCNIQNHFGGWRYQPVKKDADLSITICQIMALRAAFNCGLKVSAEVREKTIGYIEKCQDPDGSFHYTERGGRSTVALTAAGVVSYYSAGIYEGPKIEKALKWIFERRPGRVSDKVVSPMNYYYAHYYAVQAMWHAQFQSPHYWNRWYPLIRDELIDDRRRRDGTWPDARVGPEFGTAMSCIILQIPFNYVPIFSP